MLVSKGFWLSLFWKVLNYFLFAVLGQAMEYWIVLKYKKLKQAQLYKQNLAFFYKINRVGLSWRGIIFIFSCWVAFENLKSYWWNNLFSTRKSYYWYYDNKWFFLIRTCVFVPLLTVGYYFSYLYLDIIKMVSSIWEEFLCSYFLVTAWKLCTAYSLTVVGLLMMGVGIYFYLSSRYFQSLLKDSINDYKILLMGLFFGLYLYLLGKCGLRMYWVLAYLIDPNYTGKKGLYKRLLRARVSAQYEVFLEWQKDYIWRTVEYFIIFIKGL